MEKLRVGMIGTGGISHWHCRQLLELNDEVEIVALADPNEQSLATVTDKFALENALRFSDYQALLDNARPDAVVICTPHTLHAKHMMDSLAHGCHVLVEKPMTESTSQADALIAAAKTAGKVMQVSYQRHFQPEFHYIRQAVNDGVIGPLTSVTASLYQEWIRLSQGTWRQDPALSGGGFLMDSGSHIVDVLLWITGLEPQTVRTTLSRRGTPVEIDSFTSIEFAGGVTCGLNLVGSAPHWHETYAFCGERGAIFYDDGKITVRRFKEEPFAPQLPPQTTNQDKSFVDAIAGRHDVLVPGTFARRVVHLTEMIYRAAGYSALSP